MSQANLQAIWQRLIKHDESRAGTSLDRRYPEAPADVVVLLQEVERLTTKSRAEGWKEAFNAGDLQERAKNAEAKVSAIQAEVLALREGLEKVKGMVCGDRSSRWGDRHAVTGTRGLIADICDMALATPSPLSSEQRERERKVVDAARIAVIKNREEAEHTNTVFGPQQHGYRENLTSWERDLEDAVEDLGGRT